MASLPEPSSGLSAPAPAVRLHPRLWSFAETIHRPVFILFLVLWLMNAAALLLRLEFPREGKWIEGLLPVAAVATTLIGLARRLPAQNVFMAGVLVAGISSVIIAVAAISGVPFGPIVFGPELGPAALGLVPWPLPLLWVILIINGRGVARLIMRPWRKTNYYGFWVIGLTCLLAMWFAFGMEPFAIKVKNYWLWQANRAVLNWHTAPWVNFLGWLVVGLGLTILAMPWLINKHPIKQPMDYHPLVVWLLLNLYLILGNSMAGLWDAAAVSMAGNLIAAIYAVRGGRW